MKKCYIETSILTMENNYNQMVNYHAFIKNLQMQNYREYT